MIRELALVTPTGVDDLRLIDSAPVPCGMSRETAKRSDLAGEPGYGYCASHSRFFWGTRLYLRQLSLEQHGARTHGGIFARIGQRLLAMAAAVWQNTKIGAASKRSLIAYDH